MKALVLEDIGRLAVADVPLLPIAGPDDVVVKVKYAGVCSSDIPRSFAGKSYFYPAILGHEIVGTVDGSPVAVYPLIACGLCAQCMSQQPNLCTDYNYIGSRRHGGFAEFVSAPKKNIIPLPRGIDELAASLIEPTAVLTHALQRVTISPSAKILIIGDGSMGLLLTKLLEHRGFRNISLLGKHEHKLQKVKTFGGHILPSANLDGASNTFDVVFELAGTNDAYVQAIQSLKPEGHLMLIGNIRGDLVLPEKKFSSILRKELTISGNWNSLPEDWRKAAAFLQKCPEIKTIISHTLTLEDGPDALKKIYDGKLPNYIKAVFRVS